MIKNRKHGFWLQGAQSIRGLDNINQIDKRLFFLLGKQNYLFIVSYENIHENIYVGLEWRELLRGWLPGGYVRRGVRGTPGRRRKREEKETEKESDSD